jgi:hypothetical protein
LIERKAKDPAGELAFEKRNPADRNMKSLGKPNYHKRLGESKTINKGQTIYIRMKICTLIFIKTVSSG